MKVENIMFEEKIDNENLPKKWVERPPLFAAYIMYVKPKY